MAFPHHQFNPQSMQHNSMLHYGDCRIVVVHYLVLLPMSEEHVFMVSLDTPVFTRKFKTPGGLPMFLGSGKLLLLGHVTLTVAT